jgi:hypothetical protein
VSRLETLSADLAAKLRQSNAAKLRQAALAAADFGVTHAKVSDPIVSEALAALRTENRLPPDKVAELEGLVERHDNEYFDLQEAAEEGRATKDDYMRAFGQARAVAAVQFAFKENHFEAASEAIYEAAAVTDDPKVLFSAVEEVLK